MKVGLFHSNSSGLMNFNLFLLIFVKSVFAW